MQLVADGVIGPTGTRSRRAHRAPADGVDNSMRMIREKIFGV